MVARRATRQKFALLAVLFVLSASTFARVTSFAFVHDDTQVIVRNESLREPLAQTLGAVLHATAQGRGIPNATRPVTIASLTLDHRVFGLSPWGFHLHSLLLHAFVSAAAGVCAFALTRRTRVAFVAGLLFALAPLHAEAIAGITYRDELIAALGVLVALSAIAWPRGSQLPLTAEIGVAVASMIALAAKESALCLPAVLLAIWAIQRPPRADLRQRESVVFTLVGVLIVWANWRFAVQISGDGIPRAPVRGMFGTLCEAARFELYALFQALFPLKSRVEYLREAPAGTLWLVGLFLVLVLVAALARLRRTRIPALGIAFALLAPLPASPLFGPATPRADRYLYLAVFGGALVWAWAADRLARRTAPWVARTALVAAAVALIAASQFAIRPWANERTLWLRAVADAPDSPRAWTALSRVHRLAGENDAADQTVERAITLDPSYVPARVTRSHNALARGDTETAQRELRTVESLGGSAYPGFARARVCSTLGAERARECIAW
jgi:protein O-mannosyl-transferase